MPLDNDPPAGWPKPHRSVFRVVSVSVLTLVAVVTATVAVSAVMTGEVAQALVFGIGAILLGHLVGMSISALRRRAPGPLDGSLGVTDDGEQGLAFPYARWSYYWLSVVLALVAVLAAGFAAVMVQEGSATGWVLAVLAGGFAVSVVWFLVVVLRLAPGTLVLTPTGIYHRSLVLEHFVPWDAVVDIQARAGPRPWITVKAMPASGTREHRHTGRLGAFEGQALPFMVARTQWLGANSVPAYRALQHYFTHQQDRPGLTEAGLRASR
jgi:hypothetical protein